MKKLLALLLAALMCLSLAACGDEDVSQRTLRRYKEKIEELEEQIRQQEETIADLTQQLQGKDDAPAVEQPEEPAKPAPTPAPEEPATPVQPQYEEIAITLDNWETYFEITLEPTFYRNAFDEVYRLALPYYFKLKDEYFDRLEESQSKLIFESRYDYGMRFCTVDYDAQTYVLGEYVNQSFPMQGTQIVDRMGYDPTMGMYYTESFRGGTGMMDKNQYGTSIMVYDNFEILRIQGTLCLEKA